MHQFLKKEDRRMNCQSDIYSKNKKTQAHQMSNVPQERILRDLEERIERVERTKGRLAKKKKN